MQVSDLLVQYQNNLASGSEISTGTKGIEQLVETAKQLKVGNIFEGTINSIKGNQIILGLSSGQNITARLDAGINLTKGQSVFFQVKSNDGTQVQIKPVSTGAASGNPTLMRALDAATLPLNERNLNMVNAMMKEQMSIGAKNLQDMSRQVLQFPGADPASIVEMKKLDIPLTQSNVTQYENYKADAGEVLKQVQQLTEELPAAITSPEIKIQESVEYNRQLVSFFSGEEIEVPSVQVMVPEVNMTDGAEDMILQDGANQGSRPELQEIKQEMSQAKDMAEYPDGTLGGTLSKTEISDFEKNIMEIMQDLPGGEAKKEAMKLLPDMAIKDTLVKLANFLSENAVGISRDKLMGVLGHKSYKQMLNQMIAREWTIAPEELKQEHTVRDLYRKMEMQLQSLQDIASKFPKSSEAVSQAAKNLSQNIEFMNQINQTYTYVQMPIRFHGENANSELYVYRNNRGDRGAEDGSYSAFLHFDMEYLGGMDISVKMQNKNVTTNWYLDSKDTFDILSENMHLLTEKLEAKGYSCDMKLENASKKVNFVEDFLKADEKTGGEVHRYSFDVRA
ncbi:MAG: flagellar hook-length control protein FliK [Pararoseburia sp.]|nr:flagellar hook-length control protein FliK [Pararoseburia sp.]